MNIKDNRGYMLVEIILASAIAFGIAYFITSLTIKVKNKNDDTLVMTQVSTDQAIITNGFMKYAISERADFDCDNIEIAGNKITYGDNLIDIVSDYASLGEATCTNGSGEVRIVIPLTIPQLKDKDYDVNISYKYLISDVASPQLEAIISGNSATIKLSDNEGIKAGTYVIKYGQGGTPSNCDDLSSSFSFVSNGEKELTKEITLSGTDTLYVCNKNDVSDIRGNILPSNRPPRRYDIPN